MIYSRCEGASMKDWGMSGSSWALIGLDFGKGFVNGSAPDVAMEVKEVSAATVSAATRCFAKLSSRFVYVTCFSVLLSTYSHLADSHYCNLLRVSLGPTSTAMIPLRAAARHARLPCISRRNLGSVSLPAGLNGVSEADLAHFSRILPGSSILSTLAPKSLNASELSIYNEDWMGKYKGKASTVLKPKTTQEVSEILKWCWEKRIGVVPQGGNTGLVGGSVPLQDELVINLGNMNKVRSFDPVTGKLLSWLRCYLLFFYYHCLSGILVADAGCILEALSEHISPHNHIMPLDLGAKGR